MEPASGKRCLATMEGSSSNDLRVVDRSATEPPACNTSGMQGSCRLLDIFTVALGQASEGKWYVSTLELQLASFQVCVACRGVRTVRVTVDKHMSPSIWDDEDSLGDSLDVPEYRRLPALRAAGVAWKMPTAMLVPLLSGAALLKDVEWMQLSAVHCGQLAPEAMALVLRDDLSQPSVRLGHSPRSFFEAMVSFMKASEPEPNTMQAAFNWDDPEIDLMHNMGSVSWPSALRQLSLACRSYDRIDWETLPNCLERLALGGVFDQSMTSVAWPVSLTHLTLGDSFNQPITDVVWPASLLKLTFGGTFNQPITDLVWPAFLAQLTFGLFFDQPITDVVWPASLLRLAFGEIFDQPIVGVVWPASLLKLAFGDNFDQPITEVVWPASLNRLVFGNRFNHPIAEVVWPIALESLAFGHEFDQTAEGVVWPASLRWLTVSDNFAQEADAVVWPASLEPLIFIDLFDEQHDGFDWPPAEDSFDKPRRHG